MFRPPLLSPLISGQIGGLSVSVNASDEALEAALLSVHDEIGATNIAAYGGGRWVATAAQASGAGGLRLGAQLELPDARWIVDGQWVDVSQLAAYDGGFFALDEPDGEGDWWGYLSLAYDADIGYSLVVDWMSEAHPVNRQRGNPCVGKVVVEGGAVVAVEAGAEDVIWSQSLLQAKIAALVASGGGGETGGGTGGGTGGASFLSKLPVSPDDATSSKTWVESQNEALELRLRELVASGGARTARPPLDDLVHEHAITRQIAGRDQRFELERSQSGNIIGTSDGVVFGVGGDHPNFLLASNLTLNEDGTFEP